MERNQTFGKDAKTILCEFLDSLKERINSYENIGAHWEINNVVKTDYIKNEMYSDGFTINLTVCHERKS